MTSDIIHRLSKVQGQIEALKKALENKNYEEAACLNNLRLLKASINGLKKFGAAYLGENFKKCLAKPTSKKDLERLMQLAADTGFNL